MNFDFSKSLVHGLNDAVVPAVGPILFDEVFVVGGILAVVAAEDAASLDLWQPEFDVLLDARVPVVGVDENKVELAVLKERGRVR